MININFLANRISYKDKQKMQDLRVFRWSIYVLAGSFSLMILVLGFKLYNNLQINNNENQIREFRDTILAQEEVELNYLIFVNKIKVISEIYQKRSNKQEAMSYFSDVFSDKADIIGMSYQEDQGGLILQLSSDNIFQLEDVNQTLDSESLRQQYQNIEKSTLTRNEDGSYKITLKLELKTEWLKTKKNLTIACFGTPAKN